MFVYLIEGANCNMFMTFDTSLQSTVSTGASRYHAGIHA